MSPFDETRARRYLLGQLSEDETTALEDEYFASSEALEGVWAVENDLVDAFVAGELAPEERAAFERHYLASALHRERLATARVLRAATEGATRTAASRGRIPTWSVWLTVAATIVLVLASRGLRERPEAPAGPVAQVEATPTATAPTSLAAPAGADDDGRGALVPASAPRTAVAAFALSPMLLRSGQPTPTVRVPPGTDEVAITLQGDLPEGVAAGTRLRFGVATVEGARVAVGQVQVTAHALGVARIPAARVPPGDYILSVASARSADGPLRQYFFRVLP
jgi:hypothetical protein